MCSVRPAGSKASETPGPLFRINQRLSVPIVSVSIEFALLVGGQVQDVTMATLLIPT
jgi:hypothetical protein